MDKTAVVIGAGIVGASVALSLARRGYTVTVLEANEGPGEGSTALSSSVIRCHYTKRDAVALAHEGQRLWASWPDHTGLASPRAAYHQTGVLFLLRLGQEGPPSESLGMKAEMDQSGIEERVATMRSVGVATDLLDAPALRRKFPALSFPDDDVVGVWESESGYVFSPSAAVQDLHEAGEGAGVTYRFGTTFLASVTEWSASQRHVQAVRVRGPGGIEELPCSVLVNCAGPHSHEVNLRADCPLPLTTAPQRQFIVEASCEAKLAAQIPAMADLAQGFYIRPNPEVFKVGAVLPSDHVAFSLSPDDPADDEARLEFEASVLGGLRKRAPGLHLTDVQTKVAYYDWTVTDAYPILDATDVAGYFVAIGTSGAWFKGGPVIGELMAQLIERARIGNQDRRFVLRRTDVEIDLATFGLGSRD